MVAATPVYNFPPAPSAELTSFVSRRAEVNDVKRALSSSRVVTLTGVGGVGKTRLATRVAWQVRRTFTDGVWLVDLAALKDAGLLAQAVVTALGLRDQAIRWTPETLAQHVADRHLLLVFDNCEHLITGCADLVATLLRACPNLRVMATSRQPLGISGEHILPVPPLTFPDAETTVPRRRFMNFAAVQLFVDRAAAVVPDFTIDDRNASAISGICRRLDGIPLAIELAANKVRVLSPEQVLRHLDDRFGLLTSGDRAALPRQQTLRALIDWSFELCTEKEKLLWARSSVFAGSFDLEAAEQICADDSLTSTEVLNALTGLIEKSILVREQDPDHARYRLLETTRQYGREILRRTGQETTWRRRHRDWCQQLAEQMRDHWFEPDQADWSHRVRREHGNIRAALEFCLAEDGESPNGMRLADALREYWRVSGFTSEGRWWFDRLLAQRDGTNILRLNNLGAASYLALLQSDVNTATRFIAKGRQLASALETSAAVPALTLSEALVAMLRHDFQHGNALCEQGIIEFRRTRDLPRLSHALTLLGVCLSFLGEADRATACWKDLLALCEEHGEKWRRSYALWGLGVEAWRQGDYKQAEELERNSLALQRDFRDQICMGLCLEALAWIAATDGRCEEAARLFGMAEVIHRESGGPLFVYFIRYHDECADRVRRALGDRAYEDAIDQGASLTLEQAVDEVLGASKMTAVLSAEPMARLTPREREIAELIAQGMSNREIAETLVIARRTAEAHVEHILVKLGFTSRAKIAAWFQKEQST